MKKLASILGVILLLTVMSCETTTDDPPAPVEDYTIKYSVVSTGDVVVDTIMYMDKDGVEQYVFGQINFEHSFVAPSNNYSGKFYISGKIINGSCKYDLSVLDKDGGIISLKGSESSSTSEYNFSYNAIISNTSTK